MSEISRPVTHHIAPGVAVTMDARDHRRGEGLHIPLIGDGLLRECSCEFQGTPEEVWAHVGAHVAPNPKPNRFAPDATVDDRDPLNQEHWLLFDTRNAQPGSANVTGCHCGFKSDLNQQGGYADDVVDHLLKVGREAMQTILDEAYREDTGLTVWSEHPELRLQERYEAWLDDEERQGR